MTAEPKRVTTDELERLAHSTGNPIEFAGAFAYLTAAGREYVAELSEVCS